MKKFSQWGLAILVLIILGYSWFSYEVSSRLDKALAEIKMTGKSSDLLTHLAIAIPENETNVASTYEQAFKLLPEDINDTCEKARLLYKKIPMEIQAELKTKIEENEKVYQLLEQVPTGSVCVYPLNWEKGVEMDFPHLTPINQISTLASVQVCLWIEAKEYKKALSLLRACVTLGNSIHQEKIMLSALFENLSDKRLLQGLFSLVQKHPHLIPEIREILSPLFEKDWKERLYQALYAEKIMGLNFFVQISKGARSDDVKEMGGFYYLPHAMTQPFLKMDMLSYIHMTREITEISSMSWKEGLLHLKKIEAKVNDLPWYANLTKMSISSFSRFYLEGMNSTAKRETFLLALKIWELQQNGGELPQDLAGLAQQAGVSSKDPFGNEYLWSKSEAGWKVYSAGENAQDEDLSNDDEGWSTVPDTESEDTVPDTES